MMLFAASRIFSLVKESFIKPILILFLFIFPLNEPLVLKLIKSLLHWDKFVHIVYDCMLLSCHLRVSECIYTLKLPECQGTLCSKQARYLNFKWQQPDLKPQPHSS